MPVVEADLMLRAEGRPIVVVDVKRLPVTPEWRRVREVQVRMLADKTGSPWIITADPEQVRIYSAAETDIPVACIPTRLLLEATGNSDMGTVGENVLGMALERWLPSLPQQSQLLQLHPKLQDFVRDVRRADELLRWVQLDYTFGYRVELDPRRRLPA